MPVAGMVRRGVVQQGRQRLLRSGPWSSGRLLLAHLLLQQTEAAIELVTVAVRAGERTCSWPPASSAMRDSDRIELDGSLINVLFVMEGGGGTIA